MNPIDPSSPAVVETFVAVAQGAASVDAAARQQAEAHIDTYQKSVDQQSGFVCLLLQLAGSSSPAASFAAIVLKNTVKKCWDAMRVEHCVMECDKAFVRGSIIGVMLHAPPQLQPILGEAITLIAQLDFPAAWPVAMDEIVAALHDERGTVASTSGALATAHNILYKYRPPQETDEYYDQLKHLHGTASKPILAAMHRLLPVAETCEGPDAVAAVKGLTGAVESLRDICSVDMGDYLLSNIGTLVELFTRCLSLRNAYFTAGRAEPLVALKSAVATCSTHFLTYFDDDFGPHTQQLLQVVWGLIADPLSRSSIMDDVVITCIELLAGACRAFSQQLFKDKSVIHNLVKDVVIPNLTLSEEDEELYCNEPEAFILRDIEGSDQHTRRHAAVGLVQACMTCVGSEARPIFSQELNALLAGSGKDWKAKDTAIYLASSLTLQGQHVDSQRGTANHKLDPIVPFESFMNDIILAELSSPVSTNSPPIIKADCIRVITTFRDHLDPSLFPSLLSILPKWLASDDAVVLTYSGSAIDRLLSVQKNGALVVSDAMFSPHAATILQCLCVRLCGSEEPNAHLMQCLLRIALNVPSCLLPFLGDVVLALNELLTTASRNPSNPIYSHCLFEVLSKCIAIADDAQRAAIEQTIWPNIGFILANSVAEYMPYAFQLIAQLVRARPAGEREPPEHYRGLLEPLTQQEIYLHTGNIPAAVCLLSAFIEKYPVFLHAQPNELSQRILNIFYLLVNTKTSDHHGLQILMVMTLHYPADVMGKYLNTAFQVLLKRLQAARTAKYIRILILFFSVTVVVRGAADVVRRMNGIQEGLFFMILDKVWLPNMQKITGAMERKTCVVALANLLCDSEELQSNQQAWASSVYSCLKMIHTGAEDDDHTSFTPQVAQLSELSLRVQEEGFANVFCPLPEAQSKPIDVCADISDADRYFRERMTQFLRGPGALLVPVLQSTLLPEQLALIQ